MKQIFSKQSPVTPVRLPGDERATDELMILHNRGHLLAETGRQAEAIALYEQILRRDESRVQSRANLVRLLMQQHREEDALAHADILIRQGFGPGVAFKARMLYRRGHYNDAVDLCELLITEYPQQSDRELITIWYLYGKSLHQVGRIDEAQHVQAYLGKLLHPLDDLEIRDIPTMYDHVVLASDLDA